MPNDLPAGLKKTMFDSARAIPAIVFGKDEKHGPLPRLLLVLTMVTGVVDAISYLKLGRVFVANMTGNVVYLGFAIAHAQDFSIPASLVAIVAFFWGALAGGWVGLRIGQHRGRHLACASFIESAVVVVTLAVSIWAPDFSDDAIRYTLIVLLAITMGFQSATARHLGVPNLTTTVLTSTLTGLAADSNWAGGKNTNSVPRLAAIAAMLLGAALGAAALSRYGDSAALALALALLALVTFAALRQSSSPALWTEAPGVVDLIHLLPPPPPPALKPSPPPAPKPSPPPALKPSPPPALTPPPTRETPLV
jgi:uncharacterized membrane protein YoaK (UPF0700 family)